MEGKGKWKGKGKGNGNGNGRERERETGREHLGTGSFRRLGEISHSKRKRREHLGTYPKFENLRSHEDALFRTSPKIRAS